MSSSIATFNVNGLNNVSKRKSNFNYIEQKDFDITLLQETYSTAKTAKLWEMEWGGKIEWLLGTNNSRRLAILVKKNRYCKIIKSYTDPSGRYHFLDVKLKGAGITIVNVYGPNTHDPDFFKDVFNHTNNFSNNEIIMVVISSWY